MATSAATVDHLLDSLSDAGTLSARKLFGEYALYLDGVIVAFVCGDTLFIKPTPGALSILPDAEKGPAYPGSKDYIIGSEVLDNPDLCISALRAVVADAPAPQPKKQPLRKAK